MFGFLFANISEFKMNQRLEIGPIAVIEFLKRMDDLDWHFGQKRKVLKKMNALHLRANIAHHAYE